MICVILLLRNSEVESRTGTRRKLELWQHPLHLTHSSQLQAHSTKFDSVYSNMVGLPVNRGMPSHTLCKQGSACWSVSRVYSFTLFPKIITRGIRHPYTYVLPSLRTSRSRGSWKECVVEYYLHFRGEKKHQTMTWKTFLEKWKPSETLRSKKIFLGSVISKYIWIVRAATAGISTARETRSIK